MLKILLLSLLTLMLQGYELPKIQLVSDGRPEIIFFTAQSILVDEKASYILKWKTINATEVKMTFFGKVKLSGTVTVTEDEYNRGPIELKASSKSSEYVDTFVIHNSKDDTTTPMMYKEEEPTTRQYYNSRPYRGIRRPYQRRYY